MEDNLIQLIAIVERIPWYCGREDCHNDACLAIREARALILKIKNEAADVRENV